MTIDKFALRCERIVPDEPNLNRRVYSSAVLQNMVKQVEKKTSYGVLFGRLGTSDQTKIRMTDVAFRVSKARIEKDGHLGADCEILNTPKGVELETMMEKLGVDAFEIVPCGVGSTTVVDGNHVIGEDYRLAAFDIEPKIKKPE